MLLDENKYYDNDILDAPGIDDNANNNHQEMGEIIPFLAIYQLSNHWKCCLEKALLFKVYHGWVCNDLLPMLR